MMHHKIISAIFAGVLALCIAMPTSAQIVPKTIDDVVRVDFLPGWRRDDGVHIAAVRFRLAPGWKTYWRSPGDGGIPTRISWKGSKNLAKAQLVWPRPTVFRAYGLRSIGYTDELVLPILLTPRREGAIKVNAQLDFGVCDEICLPVRLQITKTLMPDRQEELLAITKALSARARAAATVGLDNVRCEFLRFGDEMTLRMTMRLPDLPGKSLSAVVETNNPVIWVGEPTLARDGSRLQANVKLVAQDGSDIALDLKKLHITLLTTQIAVQIDGCD